MSQHPSRNMTDPRAIDDTIAQDTGADTNSETEFTADEIPESLGRYRIEKLLGRGGMGEVYLAHDSQLDRRIALKIPKFGKETNPKLVERFYREARSAATLSHPNLCPVFDVGEIDGRHYIAMAYVQGQTLAAYINPDKPLAQKSAALILRKVALAMQEAHQSGIIHRDLKPANIMIDQRNEPIVMDFGLACPQDHGNDSRLTQEGALLGSPAYMSPEQLKGEPDAIGKGTDIYALGVVLYELIAGRLPFGDGTSTIAMIGRILTEEPPALQSIRADADPRITAICMKAMSKNVADRFSSMSDFATALTGFAKAADKSTTAQIQSPAVTTATISRIQLTEQSKLAKTLCESGQFSAALPILQQIIANQEGKDTKMVQWAQAMLPKVQQQLRAQSQPQPSPTLAQPADNVFSSLPATSLAPAQPLRPPPRPVKRGKSKAKTPVTPLIVAAALALLAVGSVGIAAYIFLSDSEPAVSAEAGATSAAAAQPDVPNENAPLAETPSPAPAAEDSAPAAEDSAATAEPPVSADAALFAALDQNRDGYLDEAEIPGPERPVLMGADEDRDRRISKAEFFARNPPPRGLPGRPGFRERQGGRGGPGFREGRPGSPDGSGPGRADDLMRFDRNRDGKVSRSEFPTGRPFPSSLDLNQDGAIDRAEVDQQRGNPKRDRFDQDGRPGPSGKPRGGGLRQPQ